MRQAYSLDNKIKIWKIVFSSIRAAIRLEKSSQSIKPNKEHLKIVKPLKTLKASILITLIRSILLILSKA